MKYMSDDGKIFLNQRECEVYEYSSNVLENSSLYEVRTGECCEGMLPRNSNCLVVIDTKELPKFQSSTVKIIRSLFKLNSSVIIAETEDGQPYVKVEYTDMVRSVANVDMDSYACVAFVSRVGCENSFRPNNYYITGTNEVEAFKLTYFEKKGVV